MKKILAVVSSYFVLTAAMAQGNGPDRQLWLQYMDKVARPVLMNLAQNKLKETMPVVLSPKIDNAESRKSVSYLEAFGRTLSGIGPWLN
ncbi:MAG TPA: DUF2264 domain-containing protein, partial [Flavisolibacter sp.]|nr:DUF2264 domain-containing protein [Flavisolibacter sp.]